MLAVLARQAELGKPQQLEWVHEVTPSLLPAVRSARRGAEVEECPLLVLGELAASSAAGRYVNLTPDSPDLGRVIGAQNAGFGNSDQVVEGAVGHRPQLIASGELVIVAAYDETGRVIGGGSASPRGETSELMGIAVVPSARRQGHGAAITAALVDAVFRRGVTRVFLSAAADDAASIYRAVGFERVGTACILELPGPTE